MNGKNGPDRAEIDILKAIAIIGVILIHTFSNYLFVFDTRGSVSWNFDLIIDQLSRFSVPLFVALSGYGLARKYTHSPNPLTSLKSLTEFYLRRTTKLLPWYFFWAAVIYLFVNVLGLGPTMYQNLPLWQIFLLGRADYHLYYVPMIFQLYLLFPLIFILFRVLKLHLRLILLLLLFLLQILWFNATATWSDQQQYIYFASWIFYFVLGIFLAQSQNLIKNGWIRFIPLILILIGGAWEIANAYSSAFAGIDLLAATRFTRLPVLVFASGVIAAGAIFGSKLLIIYLLHTLVVRSFFDILKVQNHFPAIVLSLAVLLISLALAEVFYQSTKILPPIFQHS